MGCCLCYERPPSEERSFLKREPARRRGSVQRSGQPAACSSLSSLSGWLSSKTKNRSAGCRRWSEPLSGSHQSQREERDGRSHSVSTSGVSRHCLPRAVLTRCHQTWRNPGARQWGQASISVFQLCFSFLTVPIEKTSLVRQQDDTSSILTSSQLSKPMEGRLLLPMCIQRSQGRFGLGHTRYVTCLWLNQFPTPLTQAWRASAGVRVAQSQYGMGKEFL